MNLAEKILVFIGYCLPEIDFKFSYQKMAEVFEKFDKHRYSLPTLRKEFSNLKRQGFITYKSRYHKKIPILTRKGKLQITPSLPYKKFGHWDLRWRIVIFEIPEKERNFRIIFQRKLEDLGFQKIQKGVYISPHPLLWTINRISTELGIRQYLTLMEADKIDKKEWTIEQIWDLEKINQEYQEFISSVSEKKGSRAKREVLIKKVRKIPKGKFWPLAAKKLEEEFAKIYKKEPHLPSELLPKTWLGDKAYKVYKEIINSY